MLSGYLWKGHRIFIDSFYSCLLLSRYLYFKDAFITGMTRFNRIGMPVFSDNMNENQCITYITHGMHLDVFKDKKKVLYILTSVYSNDINKENKKPESLRKYNEFMNGVDKANQMHSYYRFGHKTRKWWKVYFFELLEISIVNAYILYKSYNQKMSHKDFRLQLAENLLEGFK